MVLLDVRNAMPADTAAQVVLGGVGSVSQSACKLLVLCCWPPAVIDSRVVPLFNESYASGWTSSWHGVSPGAGATGARVGGCR
jgi:hypothetical protein